MKVLILAGSRGGIDPVAARAGLPFKCLVPVAGRSMLDRVVDVVRELSDVESIRVVANEPERITHLDAFTTGRAECRPSLRSLSATVAEALAELGPPLLVTTADHPLLDSSILGHFVEHGRDCPGDVAVGIVPSAVIRERHPQAVRTYLRFRDEGYSGANLFLLRTPRAAEAARIWRRIEADRKRPWRIARAFGPALLLGYLLRLHTLERAMEKVSSVVGVHAVAVRLPFAQAAIDVDKPDDLDLAEAIIASRSAAS